MIAKNWDTRTISVKISSFRKFDLENWTRKMDGQDLFLIIVEKGEKIIGQISLTLFSG